MIIKKGNRSQFQKQCTTFYLQILLTVTVIENMKENIFILSYNTDDIFVLKLETRAIILRVELATKYIVPKND